MLPPSLFVIILNWNHKEDLILTIDSFIKQDYSNFKIVVADNGSTDGSIEYLKSDHPDIILVENYINLGYAAGNNRAIEYALSQNADYVLLANNDIFLDNPNLISKIMAEMSSMRIENIGIYGIQERNYYLQNKVESEGFLLFDDFSTPERQFNVIRTKIEEELSGPVKYVDFVPGSFILIRHDVFKKCGLLDEAFFMYNEEAEFCFRAWNNGFTVVINPYHYYFHKVARSAGAGSPFSLYYRVRNNFYLLKKHKSNILFYSFFYKRYTFAIILSYIRLSFSVVLKYRKKEKLWIALSKALCDASKQAYYKKL